MAAYRVGTKGRPIDAVLLGVIVSIVHTAGVLVLGLVLFRVDRSIAIDRYYKPLNVISGLLAAALGVWLLLRRFRRYRNRALRAEAGGARTLIVLGLVLALRGLTAKV